jgi:predicted TIM-barrel fold metal-dependent hydrolase
MKKVKILIVFLLLITGILKVMGQIPQPVIDMHVHVYSPASFGVSGDFNSDGVLMKGSKSCEDHLKEIAAEFDKYNVVLRYASGDFEILDLLNENYPGEFFLSAEIWPTRELLSDQGYISELRKRLKSKEILGIGEVLNFYTGISPDDPVMDTIYKIAQEFDVPVSMHFAPGPTGVQTWGGFYTQARYRYSNPLLMEDALVKFPRLRLNIMHAGLPAFSEETFALMWMFPNVYADIGFLPIFNNYMRASLKQFLMKAVEYGFTDRIMFGSDEMRWPSAIGIGIDFLRNADYLTEEQKQDILYNNAARFLRLPGDTIKKHHLE